MPLSVFDQRILAWGDIKSTLSEILRRDMTFAVAGGTANAITASYPLYAYSALQNGMQFSFIAAATNTNNHLTTEVTVGLTAGSVQAVKNLRILVGGVSSRIVPGQIQAGSVYSITYVSSSDTFILENPSTIDSWSSVWTPALTSVGGGTLSAIVIGNAEFKIARDIVSFRLRATYTITGVVNQIRAAFPFSVGTRVDECFEVLSVGENVAYKGAVDTTNVRLAIFRADRAAISTVGTQGFSAAGEYRI